MRCMLYQTLLLGLVVIILSTCGPTVEYVKLPVTGDYVGPNVYDLTPEQRAACERRALAGDIIAAKQLVDYHDAITGDSKEFDRWMRVVARLQRERRKRAHSHHGNKT